MRTDADGPQSWDATFRAAVAAIDAGDVAALEALLAAHPGLASARLEAPGAWLRDHVGGALDGFFARPYLLWFVAEDPVRNGTLPTNIAEAARAIVAAARREDPGGLPEQLDYAMRLVAWSWIARDCGVQLGLLDVLLDAGAPVDGRRPARAGAHTDAYTDAAVYNRNFAAAEHLLARGAPLTLNTAVALARWDDVDRLTRAAELGEREAALVQAALHGNAEGLRRLLALGVAPTTVSARINGHGTALHHAVWSGKLEAVRVLAEAGADRDRRDTAYGGTPLDWAEYAGRERRDAPPGADYAGIAAYLRGASAGGGA